MPLSQKSISLHKNKKQNLGPNFNKNKFFHSNVLSAVNMLREGLKKILVEFSTKGGQ